MDRARLSALAHADHPVAAPLDDDAVDRLLGLLPVRADGTVLDVGCGTGRWLVGLLHRRADLTGTGVDLSEPALASAAAAADAAGVSSRVAWRLGDAAEPGDAPVDAALCVGSTHVLGGLEGTLSGLRERLRPRGGLLVGDGFWERPPTERARAVIGDLPDLGGVLDACTAAGWAVVGGHVSSAAEWDAYEWGWAGALTRWALTCRDTPDGEQALAAAREHLQEWVHGYRNRLGFVTLALQDTRS